RYNRLGWTGRCYFAFPVPPDDEDAPIWKPFEAILEPAKAGDFSRVPELITLYDTYESWIISGACVSLLGDARPPGCFSRLLDAMNPGLDPFYQADFCDVLSTWGRLSVVPALLDSFEWLQGFVDARFIPMHLDRMLASADAPLASPDSVPLSSYRDAVLTRNEELRSRSGADDPLVLHGARFGVVPLAKYTMPPLWGGHLASYSRRRFEAATGIDCSPFYKDGDLQPLSAMAVVEPFLESS